MRKNLALTEEETQWLLTRLGEDPYRLKKPLQYLLQQMSDDAEKLAEFTARCRANQHWVNVNPEHEPPKVKERTIQLLTNKDLDAAASLPSDQKEELLRFLRGVDNG